MSGWSGTIPEQLYTYVQTAKPTGAEEGESWYDLDDDKAYVFVDGQGSTTELTLDDHQQLAGIGPADHHNPVTVASPLVEDGAQGLSLSLANALTVDGQGSLAVSESQIGLSNLSGYPVGTEDLGFDTATQSELDSHEADTDAHHSRYADAEARTAVDGSNVSITGDAGSVDGKDSTELNQRITSSDVSNYSIKRWSNDGSGGDRSVPVNGDIIEMTLTGEKIGLTVVFSDGTTWTVGNGSTLNANDGGSNPYTVISLSRVIDVDHLEIYNVSDSNGGLGGYLIYD